MHVITLRWQLTTAHLLWSMLARELPVVADREQLTLVPVLLKLPGAELPAVLCDPSPLLIAPPVEPLDTTVKFLYLELVFPHSALDSLSAACVGDVSLMCAEINAAFAAAPRN
jgi:hypothetical protein